MRIENYEIEPYEYGYMVSEWLVKTEKAIFSGEEYKTNTKYPKDLQSAIEMVRGNLQRKTMKDTLQDSIIALQELDKNFLFNLSQILGNNQ